MRLQALNPQNLPTPKQEEWKYTNLGRFLPDGLVAAEQSQAEFIHIKSGQNGGVSADKPLMALFTGLSGGILNPSLEIKLEAGAKALVIEEHKGEGAYWKNMISEIVLEEGAQLTHIRLINESAAGVQTNMARVQAASDAQYHGYALNMGAKALRHDIQATIEGAGAHICFNGVNLLRERQHADTTILMTHKAGPATSNQFYRSVLDDLSTAVFQGKVHVERPAQKTDAYQMSNALLLSERAEMITKPELEIYADDVACSHGATSGQIDEAALFYLRSRGVPAQEAKSMLIYAFVMEVFDGLDEAQREVIEERITQWMR